MSQVSHSARQPFVDRSVSKRLTLLRHPRRRTVGAPSSKVAMSCESNGSDLVTFNVGGKIYQVLREPTLSLHPNSLLTQMAEDQKDDKPIFVEGDQDLFKFVIDYHRDRKVHLPINISKSAVLHELKRFGLEATEDQIVEDAVRFSSVKKKMIDWQGESEKMWKSAAEELLCSGIMKAAVERSNNDRGEGFKVARSDVQKALGLDESAFSSLFRVVAGNIPGASESLQRFARSFGYSMAVLPHDVQSLTQDNWATRKTMYVEFSPAP
eukprot:s687_g14.t1